MKITNLKEQVAVFVFFKSQDLARVFKDFLKNS